MKAESISLKKELHLLTQKIEQYKLKPVQFENYLIWMQILERSIKSYIVASEKELESVKIANINSCQPYIEIIKKQALIIDASGIQYPTVNQSLGFIYDVWLKSKGRIDEIGDVDVSKITVQLIIQP